MRRFVTFGRSPGAAEPPPSSTPDWIQASPPAIERSLARALRRPSGGWAVLDASDRIGPKPRRFRVAGRDLVAWRAPGGVRVRPDECPHLGASLCEGRVDPQGRIVCPWHGLALGPGRHGRWELVPVHEDGVLTWVRLPELLGAEEAPTSAPILPVRPSVYLDGAIRLEARCEVRDIVANRLDPWHGVHFHPHAFLRLRVLSEDEDAIVVRVVYRVVGPLGIEVDASFSCPDPRTIVMTIVAGDGVGSVVETHATPIEAGRTAVTEAVLATSDRPYFRTVLRARRLLRPLIERRSARLWVEDKAYAERTYALRHPRSAGDRPPSDVDPA